MEGKELVRYKADFKYVPKIPGLLKNHVKID